MKNTSFTKIILILLCGCMMMASCHRKTANQTAISSNQFAKGFTISECENWTKLVVFSPWQNGQILQTYYLVRSDEIKVPNDGIRVIVPIQRISLTSCTHIGFLKALNCLETVYGICSPEIVYNQDLFEPKDGHQVSNTGDAMTPNVELIVRTNPDIVMVSTYAQGDAATAKLNSVGLPVLYNNEWTEIDPLARAEWIRVVGALYDKLPQADSIFAEVVNSYNALKAKTEHITSKRTIMSGNNFRGTWYMPAGQTFMGQLFKDAGADYAFQNDTSHFSIPLGIESVIHTFRNADVWVGCPAKSLAELAQMDEKHTWFKAYQQGEVYNFAKRTTPNGGNDFWEMGVVRPDYILHDLITILYPDLIDNSACSLNNADLSPASANCSPASANCSPSNANCSPSNANCSPSNANCSPANADLIFSEHLQ